MLIRLLLVLFSAISLIGTGNLYAQGKTSLRVISVDTSHAPQVEITLDYSMANGQPVEQEPAFAVRIANQPLNVSTLRRSRMPINVAIITDLSARMSDQGAPYTTRFQNMQPLVSDLVSQLQSGTNYASLITVSDSVRMPHALGSDLQAIANTLNRGNPDLVFESQPLKGAVPTAPYPLYDAIRNGIAQMVVGEVRPRTLVIFASGGIEPGQIERLREEIDLARNDRAPIQVLVFGFGSAQSFDTFPAETESLAKLAVELDGTFIDLGNELPSVQTRQRIDSQFNAILRRGEQWVISANTGAVPVGAVSLQVEAGGSTSEFMFQNPAVPPSVTLKASSTSWQGDVSLTIASPIAQAPITQVQYLLDNYLIGESSLATGAYSYSFSSTDRTFLSHFPPGEHMLVAAVTDERGLQSRSDPLTITLLAPAKPDGMVGVLMEYWWVILLLVIATLAVVSMKTVFKVKKPSSKVGTNPVNPPSQEDPTKRYGEPSIDPPPPIDAGRTQKFDDGKATKRLDDDEEKTGRFDPLYGAKSVSRWFLYIVEGAESATFDLQAQRHYDIGRPARGHQPHIPINNTLVSRNHAKLERLVNGLELRALETENGTFLGEERRQLKTNECVSLKSGDVFWLSPQVKLRVESQG